MRVGFDGKVLTAQAGDTGRNAMMVRKSLKPDPFGSRALVKEVEEAGGSSRQ